MRYLSIIPKHNIYTPFNYILLFIYLFFYLQKIGIQTGFSTHERYSQLTIKNCCNLNENYNYSKLTIMQNNYMKIMKTHEQHYEIAYVLDTFYIKKGK